MAFNSFRIQLAELNLGCTGQGFRRDKGSYHQTTECCTAKYFTLEDFVRVSPLACTSVNVCVSIVPSKYLLKLAYLFRV